MIEELRLLYRSQKVVLQNRELINILVHLLHPRERLQVKLGFGWAKVRTVEPNHLRLYAAVSSADEAVVGDVPYPSEVFGHCDGPVYHDAAILVEHIEQDEFLDGLVCVSDNLPSMLPLVFFFSSSITRASSFAEASGRKSL